MTGHRTMIIDRRAASAKEPKCWNWHFTVEVYDGVQSGPRFVALAGRAGEARRLADEFIRRQKR